MKDDICGVTEIGGSGIEWICVLPPHNLEYVRQTGDYHHRKGDVVRGTGGHRDGPNRRASAPRADRHYFVRKYPPMQDVENL